MSDKKVLDEKSPSFAVERVEGDLKMPSEPNFFTRRDVMPTFAWAADIGTSDITIQSNEQIILDIAGAIKRVTNRKLTHNELMEIAVEMYADEGAKAILSGNRDMDFAYSIRPSRNKSFRFRTNITPILSEGTRGIQITARTIPDMPPKLEDMKLDKEIVKNIFPHKGMVLIVGATGSGKSTLLAAIIRYMLEEVGGNRKILTYESPIEFVYDGVNKPSSSIAQTEIPTHLRNFAEGTRNALRRKPTTILVGEARDAETIAETIIAAMTGHALYSTLHANNVPDTVRRMVNLFPAEERNGRAGDILSSLNIIVCQVLVKGTDLKRVALREYLVITDEVRDFIMSRDLDKLTATCREAMDKWGHSFLQDAEEHYKAGRISATELKYFTNGRKRLEEEENRGFFRSDEEVAEKESEAKRNLDLMKEILKDSGIDLEALKKEYEKKMKKEEDNLGLNLPGLLDADEMSHVEDELQEPRISFGFIGDKRDEKDES